MQSYNNIEISPHSAATCNRATPGGYAFDPFSEFWEQALVKLLITMTNNNKLARFGPLFGHGSFVGVGDD